MFFVIVVKEIRNNISNLRFSIGMILCSVLTILCVVILSHQYVQEFADYNTRLMLQDEFMVKYAHTNRIRGVAVPPMPPDTFRPLIMGLPDDTFTYMGGFFEDPLPVLFPHIDLIFIVTVIMSLLAILFSYDAVTGERENGTLRLIVSNSLKRPALLLSKWIGGTVSLFIPFTFSLLVGVLYIAVHPSIRWGSTAYAAFFFLLAASMLFISSFFLLGLLMSSLTRTSATSILGSLFLWVLLIFVVPNLSPYLAAQVFKIPSVTKYMQERSRIQSEDRDEIGRKLGREVTEKYQREYGVEFNSFLSMKNDAIRERVTADPEFAAMVNAYRKEYDGAWREANRIQGEKSRALDREFNNKVSLQEMAATNIACLSPYANYLYVARDITGTGFHSRGYFRNLANGYMEEFDAYLEKKTAEAKKIDPLFDSNMFLDVSDRPRFAFTEEPLTDRLIVDIYYWGALVFFNVLFFAGAYVSFLRYDVR